MPNAPRAYKEIRLQQLRSFCETARLGSLTAAAQALDLAQPTVWEQVHALERFFDAPLIVRQAHGCKLTETGRLLAELAAPLVSGIDSLKRHLGEARGQVEPRLTVAATQRILTEDLPPCVVEFERRYPQVRLRLLEMRTEQVADAVEAGEADLGLTPQPPSNPPSPRLEFSPAYELDFILVTPRDHPLARKRRVSPRDLVGFPLVNSPSSIPDPALSAMLEKLGVFQTQPRRVEAFYSAVIRCYVELGFGIGLVVGLPSRRPTPNLHERPLGNLGRLTINLVWKKGSVRHETAGAFADTIRALLHGGGKTRP